MRMQRRGTGINLLVPSTEEAVTGDPTGMTAVLKYEATCFSLSIGLRSCHSTHGGFVTNLAASMGIGEVLWSFSARTGD